MPFRHEQVVSITLKGGHVRRAALRFSHHIT
jgi:hypothetical protein